MEFICSNTDCKKIFIYPSHLKLHLEKNYHCKKTCNNINLYIEEIINNKKNNKAIIEYNCIFCNKIYANKFTLSRHINNSKCTKEHQEKQKQIILLQTQIDELKQSHLQPTINPLLTQNDNNQQIQTQINNINQIEQQTINNNNLTINNNITIIQHINPSGYESLPSNISMSEMIRLLNLGDKGVVEIVKLVCDQEENKNFYKLNMNKANISFLNNNYKIDICQDKELKDKLLKQCVILTYRMLINCSSILTSEQIYKINSNLQNISEKMKEEIYDNGLKNIIEYELRNNSKVTKNKINKYTTEIITNPEIKDQAKNNYKKLLQIKEDTIQNKLPIITLYDINQKLGNPITIPELDFEFTFNEFNSKRFEYTTYYNYWIKRIKDENKYIKSHPNTTIGDITYFENRKKEIIVKLEKMRDINDKMRDIDDNNNLIITKDNFRVEIANDYIKENERLKLQILLNDNNDEDDDTN
jgi:hypothetical protein